MSDQYVAIATAIIKQQELVVGPLSWSEADKISDLSIKDHDVSISGDGKQVVEALVGQYQTLFGRASVEVCREAAKPIVLKMEPNEVPKILLS